MSAAVDPVYRHYPKRARYHARIDVGGVALKLYFLLVSVWRGSNELWEAVWYREGNMPAFAPFDPGYPSKPGVVRPTFCVWELGIVAHESGAWGRFLACPRDDAARSRWLEDGFEGAV